MIKELHTVHGSILLKMDTIEAGLAATGYDLPAEARHSRMLPRLQRQVADLSARVAAAASSGAGTSASGASSAGVKALAAGMAELRAAGGQAAAALAALQEALPLVAEQVGGLEARVSEGLAVSGQSLDTLARQLHALQQREPRPQRPHSPFAGERAAPPRRPPAPSAPRCQPPHARPRS
jgi:hypothetical protein